MESAPFPATTLDLLWSLYGLLQNAVQYADSKNTTLLAFNGVVVSGIITAFFQSHSLWQIKKSDYRWRRFVKYAVIAYLMNVSVCCMVSAFFNLSAMQAQRTPAMEQHTATQYRRLTFWGTIAQFDLGSVDAYILAVKEQYYGLKSQAPSRAEQDIGEQVIILSQIASRKYMHFNRAMSWTIAGILTPLALPIQELLLKPELK
jgi:hypothetical protein